MMTKENQTELWKPIPRCDGYFASNLGRVKGPRIIYKGHVDPKGYVRVSVIEDGKRVYRNCSTLVARAFHGETDLPMTLHNNGNPSDNRPENLRYGTAHDNYNDARNHGTNSKAEKHGSSKLTIDQVKEIKSSYIKGVYGYRQISNKYGVDQKSIYNIVKDITWKTI